MLPSSLPQGMSDIGRISPSEARCLEKDNYLRSLYSKILSHYLFFPVFWGVKSDRLVIKRLIFCPSKNTSYKKIFIFVNSNFFGTKGKIKMTTFSGVTILPFRLLRTLKIFMDFL